MNRKPLSLILVLLLATTLLFACAKTDAPKVAAPSEAPVATAEPVTLTITGGWPDFRALDVVAKAFTEQYPNCTIVYEYIQDYYASLEKRMAGNEPIDLFITTNLQTGSALLPYAVDLYAQKRLDLSNTFDGLRENFELADAKGEQKQLYAIPLGADLRGYYVNKTLLASLGVEVPTNQQTLLDACQKLADNGYIPMHGNPGSFPQTLLYPWICNLIANADDPVATHKQVNDRVPGVSELFREPMAFLYKLVENGFYNYKKAQSELNLFVDSTDEAYSRDFLNIVQKDDRYEKADDVGRVAFMASPMSIGDVVARTKEDYHSAIEYEFMLAPVGAEGGFAYLSPAHAIAICNKSPNPEWAVKFLDFLFTPDNNKLFAQAFNVMPNTKDVLDYLGKQFDLPQSRVSQLGQVTFDYSFYEIIHPVLVDLSKCNNPKYMQEDGTPYPLEHFMQQLEAALTQAQ